MSSSSDSLNEVLSQPTLVFGLRIWVLLTIGVCILVVLILVVISMWVALQRRKRKRTTLAVSPRWQIPVVSKEIVVDSVCAQNNNSFVPMPNRHEATCIEVTGQITRCKSAGTDTMSECSSIYSTDRSGVPWSGDNDSSGQTRAHPLSSASPLVGLPEFSHLGWGHWFTLRDLEHATNWFAKDNILGEGGYGVVYRGRLANGTDVAVKAILNNVGQAAKEFRVEVEAIGHVRHKNLVRLLGYCVEGTHRMLVYEFVKNGNLEQWIHGDRVDHGTLNWDKRMNICLGTAKALAYLHEAIEPKVVHRDIKSSNILIDDEFNAKVSDFGLAKLLNSDRSHISTRVMGTYGYVAPEYANTGMLNEKSDIYSFGVVLLEAITGRDPVDYARPADEVNLVQWVKLMVGQKRTQEVVDHSVDPRPTTRSLKRAILAALRCVDPDAEKRPRMSQVVHMVEAAVAAGGLAEDRRSMSHRRLLVENAG